MNAVKIAGWKTPAALKEDFPVAGFVAGLTVFNVGGNKERAYPIRKSKPHQMVAFLLEQRGLALKDLAHIIGSTSRASEIVSGKRSISKAQAKKLAAYFRVRADLFI